MDCDAIRICRHIVTHQRVAQSGIPEKVAFWMPDQKAGIDDRTRLPVVFPVSENSAMSLIAIDPQSSTYIRIAGTASRALSERGIDARMIAAKMR